MEIEAGGHHDSPGLTQDEPSLLIATCLIGAIRKMVAARRLLLCELDLNIEIEKWIAFRFWLCHPVKRSKAFHLLT